MEDIIKELDIRVEKKLLSKVTKGDLAIYCYSQKCVYEKVWDKYTKMARGLIVNVKTGEIIARPFTKFFNLNETGETKLENLPIETPEITEKLDGSLGIFYNHNNEYLITTKGTFYSEQGEWATQHFRKKFHGKQMPEGVTLLFEIIYPENRIVIDYGGKRELFLIGAIETKSGKDYSYKEIEEIAEKYRFVVVGQKPLSLNEVIEKTASLPANEEGFVARFSNGLRVKMKGTEYLHIHRILSNLSLLSIWEKLREGTFNKEFLEKIPEEFRKWTEKTASIISGAREKIDREVLDLYKDAPKKDRKEFALWVQKQEKKYQSLLFSLHDKDEKRLNEVIFKIIRPANNRWQEIHGVKPEDAGEKRLERIQEENM
ncbi:MAG: T4 RnlA family RNA ligase [Candidatus Micrarchaeota archaeon]|nr:T4 RnlA family RNA ligase [Candidatus Micrarchaeota archaeon]